MSRKLVGFVTFCFKTNSKGRSFSYSFPLMEKNQKIKPIWWSPFPVIVVFLPQIGETTLIFEGLKVEVLSSCHATTREALYSVLLSVKNKRLLFRTE